MFLKRSAWGAVLVGLSLVGLYFGCSGGDTSPSSPGDSSQGGSSAGLSGASGAGVSGSLGAGTAGVGGSSGGVGSGGFPRIGADWLPYKPKNSPCTYYFMPSGGTPPAPLEWGPCVSTGIQDVACQELVLPPAPFPWPSGLWLDRWANPPHLFLGRLGMEGFELDFWRMDGTFAGAIANADLNNCYLTMGRPPNDGTYFLDHLEDTDGSKSFVLAGNVGQTPTFEIATGEAAMTDKEDYFGTKNWMITLGDGIYASPWNSKERELIYSPGKHFSGLPALPEFGHEDTFFLKLSAAGKSGWVAWVAGKGIQDLFIHATTYQRGFTSLGTDGVDLVVTYGEDAPSEYDYQKRTLLRADYSTDPQELKNSLKAIANIPEHSPTKRWAVGCGYAAIGGADEQNGVSLLVVRLSDGMLWQKFPFTPNAYGGIQPTAITCQEIFLYGGHKSHIQRITLGSLGEGKLSPPQVSQWPF